MESFAFISVADVDVETLGSKRIHCIGEFSEGFGRLVAIEWQTPHPILGVLTQGHDRLGLGLQAQHKVLFPLVGRQQMAAFRFYKYLVLL